jgi:galactonate dehydratase
MKITKIETFKYWIQWCNWLLVKVSTDDGLYGWGEGSLHGQILAVEAVIHDLEAYLIGQDPSGIERHWQGIYRSSRWRKGPVLSTALGALDIALWDLEGKRLNVPVYRLLGGPFRTSLRVYASHWLEHVKTPQAAFDGARQAITRGFIGFKWRPFDSDRLRENETREISLGADLMAAAREGAGPEAEIFIECAEQFSPRTAPRAINALAPFRPAWIEEPIPFENPAAMINLQREVSIPIACGERLISRWDVLELLEKGGVKILQPDVMHCGGITEMRKIASLADMFYVPISPHNPGGPICTLASMHLAAAIPNFYILEQMEKERTLRDEITGAPLVFKDSSFELPTGPGLGIDIDLAVLEAHKFQPQPISGKTEPLWY